ncbi:MAG: MarR family EPS-associated transcriptional regulator [Candidatus Omnitrophota bacterium]
MKHLEETIKLLDHIKEKPEATQRELVKELDISLGKVNFLLKALADKGIIKLERFKNSRKKLGYLYIITPKGLAEKSRITADFLKRKLKEYDELKREISELKLKLNLFEDSGSKQLKQI